MEKPDVDEQATETATTNAQDTIEDLMKKQLVEQARIERLEKGVRAKCTKLMELTKLPWTHDIVELNNAWRVALSYNMKHKSGRDKREEDYLVEDNADSMLEANQMLTRMLDSELEAMESHNRLLGLCSVPSVSSRVFSCLKLGHAIVMRRWISRLSSPIRHITT